MAGTAGGAANCSGPGRWFLYRKRGFGLHSPRAPIPRAVPPHATEALPRLVLLLLCAAAAAAPLPCQQGPAWGPWQVIGPFDHPKGSGDNRPAHPPEVEFRDAEVGAPWEGLSESHRGKGKKEIRWWPLLEEGDERATAADVGVINFLTVFPKPAGAKDWTENAVAYLYRSVRLEKAGKVDLNLGSDDGLRVWLDGELVHDRNVARGVNVQSDRLLLQLEAGDHHLLVKVNNGGGAWGFAMKEHARPSQEEINAAIDRGVQYLLSCQLLDGSWGEHQPRYRNGVTSLVAYTLLKSGLPPRHPALLRAFAYLREEPPTMTYSIGCQMLAIAAARDPDFLPWMEELTADLGSWQDRMRGAWAYPEGEIDLSCTQYAALGLLAAEQSGIDIPDRVWNRLVDGVLDHQDRVRKVDAAPGASGRRMPVAGFAYRRGNPKQITGSMTVAGIATLEICRRALDLPPDSSANKRILKAQNLGINWLAGNYTVARNPGKGDRHYYYLYGLERAGSLLGTETFGGREWYWDGAELLLRQQKDKGQWSEGGRPETISCYALLFLKRATAAATTGQGKSASRSARSKPADGPVRLVVIPGEPTALYIEGVAQEEGAEPVAEVRYRLRQPGGDWLDAGTGLPRGGSELAPSRYSVRFSIPVPGEWEAQAVAVAADGGELLSGVVPFLLEQGVVQAELRYAADSSRNLLPRARPEVTASSGNGRALADNLWGSRWLCDPKDAAPAVEIKLKRGLRTSRIQFSHARTRSREQEVNPRPVKVELQLNRDKEVLVVEIDPNPQRKTVFELEKPRTISRLRLRVVETTGGALGNAAVGFSEVELHGPSR